MILIGKSLHLLLWLLVVDPYVWCATSCVGPHLSRDLVMHEEIKLNVRNFLHGKLEVRNLDIRFVKVARAFANVVDFR